MSFHVGQRVVCVDDSPTIGYWKSTWFGLSRRWVPCRSDLKRGEVYTISAVYEGFCRETRRSVLGVQLAERKPFSHNPTGGYEASRFRPLSESRLDQFRVHLAPVGKERVSA